MTPEEIARRFSRRAGFRLAAYRQAALPVFRLTLRVLTLVRKPLPAIHEFTLRAMEVGLERPEDVSGFLGLEQEIVNASIFSLMESESIVIGAIPGSRTQRLVLTEKGKLVLAEASLIVPEEMHVRVDVDGLTRSLALPEEGKIRPKGVEEAGLLELPAHPQRKPRVDEIRLPELQSLLKERGGWGDGDGAGRDIIAVLEVERSEHVFRDDVLLLVYRAVDGDETQFALVVDGHLSDQHEVAFGKANQARQFKFVPDRLGSLEPELKKVLSEEILGRADSSEQATNLHLQIQETQRQVEEISSRLHSADSPTERTRLRAELAAVEGKAAKLQATLDAMPVRQVEVFDHSQYLREALETSRTRVMIISPWIKGMVVNETFLRLLEAALGRGVNVYIGYGLEGEGRRETDLDREAVRKLGELAQRFGSLRFIYFGDTHAKVLVCDDRFVITTSFNWLSFLGDPERTYRDERGMYVGIPDEVERVFNSYLPRFHSPIQ